MAAKKEIGLGTRLAIGGIAGFVATMAMTSAMRHLHRRLPRRERYPLTPREIVDSALDPPASIAPDLTLALHFAYGAGCGALLAAANPRIGRFGGALALAIAIGTIAGHAFKVARANPIHALRYE